MARLVCSAAVLGAAALALNTLASAQAPPCGADLAGAQRAESASYTVAYRMIPAQPAISRHFSMELAVCAKPGAPAPEALRVDARMPAHGHGMNYKAAVKSLGGDRFQAEGLLLHMPGRWEFVFDVIAGETPERATHSITLR